MGGVEDGDEVFFLGECPGLYSLGSRSFTAQSHSLCYEVRSYNMIPSQICKLAPAEVCTVWSLYGDDLMITAPSSWGTWKPVPRAAGFWKMSLGGNSHAQIHNSGIICSPQKRVVHLQGRWRCVEYFSRLCIVFAI